MDMIDIAIAKAFATKVAAGFSKVEVDGMTINFTLNDGTITSLTVPTPADGISVTDINIDENGNLICTMSNETEINAGKVLPEKGVDYYTTEEIEEVKTEIEGDLQESIDEVQTQIIRLRSNFDRNTPTPSDNLTIEDAINDVVDLYTPIGKTSQKSYTGKNKFNKNDIVARYLLEDGTVATSVSSNDWKTSNYIPINQNTSYVTSGMLYLAGANPSRCYYDQDKNYISGVKHNNTNPFIDTSPANAYYMRESCHLYDLDTVQIEEGSTATDYESYVGGISSPNPNYPQPIENVIGDVITETSNKNIFTGNFSQFNNQGGTGSTYAYFKLPNDNDAYTLTLIAKNDFTSQSALFIGFTGNGGDSAGGYTWVVSSSSGAISKGTIISKTSSQLRYISLYSASAQTLKIFTDNFDIILEKASAYTSYTLHQGQSITFPLAEGQKLMQGDYLAENGIHHVRGQVVFDGSSDENWSKIANAGIVTKRFVINISDRKNGGSIDLKSNRFIQGSSITSDNFIVAHPSVNVVWFGSTILQDMTIEEFRAYLSENNLLLEYELAQEQIDPYTSEQQTVWNELQKLETYKDCTHIYTSSDGLAPDSKVTYLVNPLSSIEARLSALEA